MSDAATSGRGRALFAGIRSGVVHRFAVQTSFPTEASLGEIAHVIPLLRADDGHPRVMILVGRDTLRVLEARLGRADELRAFDREPIVYDGAERKGPTASNPLRGQKVSTQRERWERQVEADHRRRLAGVGHRVARLAAQRRWELGVVAGEPRTAEALVEILGDAGVESGLIELEIVGLASARPSVRRPTRRAGVRDRRAHICPHRCGRVGERVVDHVQDQPVQVVADTTDWRSVGADRESVSSRHALELIGDIEHRLVTVARRTRTERGLYAVPRSCHR